MGMFSPVAKMSTVRVLLALATSNNWFLHQMDMNNTFLHGDLHEEMYIYPLEGYDISAAKVLKLTKSLYGLKQASRQWYSKLSDVLIH